MWSVGRRGVGGGISSVGELYGTGEGFERCRKMYCIGLPGDKVIYSRNLSPRWSTPQSRGLSSWLALQLPGDCSAVLQNHELL
jgi:hypothetical protein